MHSEMRSVTIALPVISAVPLLKLPESTLIKMQGKVRIICNSQLQVDDVKFIKNQPQAMKLEWCEGKPEEELAKSLKD